MIEEDFKFESMNISLPTGNIVYVSVIDYLFLLPEDKVDEFYQSLIAENAGIPAPDNPFSQRAYQFVEIDVDEIDEELDEIENQKN
jgi:hypothetical protein